MLRLSSLLTAARPHIARLTRLLRREPQGGEAALKAPPPPWPIRTRMILVDAGLILGLAAAAVAGLVFLAASPEPGFPVTIVSFSHGSGHEAIGEGETGAHIERLKIDDDMLPFLESGPYGPLPKIATGGETPAKRFARHATPSEQGATISIIVSGLGLDDEATRSAIARLPKEVTLAFSPYARNLAGLTELARKTQHEFLLEAPLEPFDYPQSDPGPLVLLVDAPQSTNLDRLHHTMGGAVGYIGFLTTARARFATSEAALLPIAKESAQRGLVILDDGRAPISKMPRVTRQTGTLSSVVDRRLDDRPSADGIALALIEFERLAIEQGRAIGAMDLYPVALDRLVRWTTTLQAKGLALQPVSAQILPPDTPEPSGKKSAKPKDEHKQAERH